MHRFLLYSLRNHNKNPFIKDIFSFYLKRRFDIDCCHKTARHEYLILLVLKQFWRDRADPIKVSIIFLI